MLIRSSNAVGLELAQTLAGMRTETGAPGLFLPSENQAQMVRGKVSAVVGGCLLLRGPSVVVNPEEGSRTLSAITFNPHKPKAVGFRGNVWLDPEGGQDIASWRISARFHHSSPNAPTQSYGQQDTVEVVTLHMSASPDNAPLLTRAVEVPRYISEGYDQLPIVSKPVLRLNGLLSAIRSFMPAQG